METKPDQSKPISYYFSATDVIVILVVLFSAVNFLGWVGGKMKGMSRKAGIITVDGHTMWSFDKDDYMVKHGFYQENVLFHSPGCSCGWVEKLQKERLKSK